jgi:hypothetical protein
MTSRSSASGKERRNVVCRARFRKSSQKLGPTTPHRPSMEPMSTPWLGGSRPLLPTANPASVGTMIRSNFTPR